MERAVGVMVGGRAAGGIHILSAYPYFIEALITLSDGQDGDLIRPLSHLSFVLVMTRSSLDIETQVDTV